jgi:hypothetical protein
MSWYAVSNLVDGRWFYYKPIDDPSTAAEGEKVIPGTYLNGIKSPVWDAALERPVSFEEWCASRPDEPHGPGIAGRLLGPALEGTNNELPNAIGSFGARLTYDLPIPSEEWTKIPFDEVMWDTGGMFDPRHGAFVAGNDPMHLHFRAGTHVPIVYAVGTVRIDLAIYRNGSLEHTTGSTRSGAPELKDRGSYRGLGQKIDTQDTKGRLGARAGDMFEVYIHHNVGAEVLLTTKGMHPSGVYIPDPDQEQPSAIYFMGMYHA